MSEKMTKDQMKLFETYSPMVINLANNLYEYVKEMDGSILDVDDLMQIGFIGLIKGIRSYNPDFNDEDSDPVKRSKEQQYIYKSIKAVMLNEIDEKCSHIKIPRSTKELYNKSPEKLDEETCKKIKELLEDSSYINIDTILETCDEEPDFLSDIPCEYHDVVSSEIKRIFDDVTGLALFTKQEVSVLKRYFGLDGEDARNIVTISKEDRLSAERVSQVIHSALHKLRRPFILKRFKDLLN